MGGVESLYVESAQMSRLLLLVALVLVVYLLFRSFRKNIVSGENGRVTEDMVRCEHCGVHLPKGESVQSEGRFFCNADHRDNYKV